MPAPVFAFVAAFITTAISVGAVTATVFAVAVVSAALTYAASILYKIKPPPQQQLAERKQTVRVPTPTRKVLYGRLQIGAAIVRIDSARYGRGGDVNHSRRDYAPELHILPFRPTNASTVGTTGTADPSGRDPVRLPVVLASSLPDRTALRNANNLTEGWTVYHTWRQSVDARLFRIKYLTITYAVADNKLGLEKLYVGSAEVSEPSSSTVRGDYEAIPHTDPARVAFNRRPEEADYPTYERGTFYVDDLDGGFGSNLREAQAEAYELTRMSRGPGWTAAFLWDFSGDGTYDAIFNPHGIGYTRTDARWPLGFTDRSPGHYQSGGEEVDFDRNGVGVSWLTATFLGYPNTPQHVPWPSIPQVSMLCNGRIRATTWAKIQTLLDGLRNSLNQSYWQYCRFNNAAACLYDYLLAYTDYGTDVLGVSRIDADSMRQAIIDCHDLELVANAYVDLDSRPDDVIAQFALAMRNGDVYDVGGILHVIVGKPVAASATITEDDILTDWTFVGGLSRDQRPDAINVEYPTTEGVGTDTIRLSPDFIRGEGSGLTEDLTVAYAGNRETALDVAAIRLLQAQESKSLELTVRAAHARLLPNDTVMVDIPTLFGGSAGPQKYRVLSVAPQPDLSLRLTLREERDEIWRGYDLLNPTDKLLLETGDSILLESGDNILIS